MKALVWFSRIGGSIFALLLWLTVPMPTLATAIMFTSLCVWNIADFIKEL
jgi:hypothetical protein